MYSYHYFSIFVCIKKLSIMKIKIVTSTILASLLFCIQAKASNTSIFSGSGSKELPYLIENASQLMLMSQMVTAGTLGYDTSYYKITCDINLNDTTWYPIGATSTNPFKGTIDGQGHTISNMKLINEYVYGDFAGLLGFAESATIKNINISNSSIQLERTQSAQLYIGGICGYADNTSIYNCHSSCTINVKGESSSNFTINDQIHIGGICGYAKNSEISICHNSGTITSSSICTATNDSHIYTGGICGYSDSTSTTICYNTATIHTESKQTESYMNYFNKAFQHNGGICGYQDNHSIIQSCYNVGEITNTATANNDDNNITTTKYAGGICGYSLNNSYCKNSFFVDDCQGSGTYGGAKSTTEIMQSETFVNIINGNFEKAFVYIGNSSFPALNKIYDIQIGTNTTNGTILGSTDFFEGKQFELTAIPDSGYHFAKWSDDGETNPNKFTVSKDTKIDAIFEINKYSLDVKSNNENEGTTYGSGIVQHDSLTEIKAIAKEGYAFSYWSDSSLCENPMNVKVTCDTSFTAIFHKLCKIDITPNDSTFGNISIAGAENGGYCEANTTITMTAIADTNYSFLNWSDGNTDNPRSITIDSTTSMSARFGLVHNISTLTDNSWGYVTGGGLYEHGTNATLMAVATQWVNGTGFGFIRWSDGNRDNPRIVNVTKDTTFAAIFSTVDTFYIYVHDTTIIYDTIYLKSSVDNKQVASLNIYPNPTTTYINVSAQEEFSYILTDNNGKAILKEEDSMSYIIDMSEQPDGVYFITTSDGVTHKVIKE